MGLAYCLFNNGVQYQLHTWIWDKDGFIGYRKDSNSAGMSFWGIKERSEFIENLKFGLRQVFQYRGLSYELEG